MRRRITALVLTLLAVLTIGLLVACEEDVAQDQRQDGVETRYDGQAAATLLHPLPEKVNYPAFGALVEFDARTDAINHPWYVYILGDNGNVIGYYVATTRPVNSCSFLSSTQDVRSSERGNLILQAPSLDGTYSSGAGAAAACDAWFFFDTSTDAMIEIRGVNYYVSDQPLLLDAEPINVAVSETE